MVCGLRLVNNRWRRLPLALGSRFGSNHSAGGSINIWLRFDGVVSSSAVRSRFDSDHSAGGSVDCPVKTGGTLMDINQLAGATLPAIAAGPTGKPDNPAG